MTNNTHTHPYRRNGPSNNRMSKKPLKQKREKMQQHNKELIIFEKLLKIKSESAR